MPHYLQGENVMDSFQIGTVVNQQGRAVRIARLAAIVDCEGTLYLNRSKSRDDRHYNKGESYVPVMRIVSSDMRTINEVCATIKDVGIGFNRMDEVGTYEGYGNVSTVSFAGMKRFLQFASIVGPFLSAKSQVLDVIKSFCERRGRLGHHPYTDECYRLVRAVRAINSKGTARDIAAGDHLELVGPSRVAKLTTEEKKAKLAAIVECDGSMGLTNLRGGASYMPQIGLYNTNESLLSEIRQSLADLGIAYYFMMRPPRGIGTKPAGQFDIQGMKRVKRFLDATRGYYVAYADRAELLIRFIDQRLSVNQNTPYSEFDRDIKKQMERMSKDNRLPSTTARKIDECLFRNEHYRKIQSALRGDTENTAEMAVSSAS